MMEDSMMIRWRVFSGVLLATLVLALSSAPVGASSPIRFPAGFFPGTDTSCGFPIDITLLSGKQVATLFFDANGVPTRELFTGVLKVRFTNASGEYFDFNVSGPGTITFKSDGSGVGVGRGPEVVGVLGHLWFFDGLVVLNFPLVGPVSIVSHTGFAEDLCPVLAPS
jgi:hypothetical protein